MKQKLNFFSNIMRITIELIIMVMRQQFAMFMKNM